MPLTMDFEAMLGPALVDAKKTSVDTVGHLRGKHALLYFSAHWCPPCREFTPKLAKWCDAGHAHVNMPCMMRIKVRKERQLEDAV